MKVEVESRRRITSDSLYLQTGDIMEEKKIKPWKLGIQLVEIVIIVYLINRFF